MGEFSRNGAARVLNPSFPQTRIYERDLRDLEEKGKLPPVDVIREPDERAYYVARSYLRLMEQKHGIDVKEVERALGVIHDFEKAGLDRLYRRTLKELGKGTFYTNQAARDRASAAKDAAGAAIDERLEKARAKLHTKMTQEERAELDREVWSIRAAHVALKAIPDELPETPRKGN